jgi:hypothetical protein
MISAGYKNEDLLILAGEQEPFNQFELQRLTDKILAELNLDLKDQERIIKNYATYLIDKNLNGEIEQIKVLYTLRDICIELGYEKYLYDFYLLYFAKDDLITLENTWYWPNVNKSNIDDVIKDYFVEWKMKNNLFGIS